MRKIRSGRTILLLILLAGIGYGFRDHYCVYPGRFQVSAADTTRPCSCFLAISDVHLFTGKSQQQAESRAGDSGGDLWEEAKSEIRSTIRRQHPYFVLFLGDLPFHFGSKGDSSMADVHTSFDKVYHDVMQIARSARIPFFLVPGNNDSWEGDYGPFDLPDSFFSALHYPLIDFSQGSPHNRSVMISSDHLPSDGYYSAYPGGEKHNLRLIGLNTTMFTAGYQKLNAATWKQSATAQISWLRTQLNEVANLQEHALIFMHVPPGLNGFETFRQHKNIYMWADSSLENEFLQVMQEYKNYVVGMLSSHTHMDGMSVLRNSAKDSINGLLLSIPGIAPGHGNNPAIKMIYYNPVNFALTHFSIHFMPYWNADRTGTLKKWDGTFGSGDMIKNGRDPLLSYLRSNPNGNAVRSAQQLMRKIYTAGGQKQDTSAIDAPFYLDFRVP